MLGYEFNLGGFYVLQRNLCIYFLIISDILLRWKYYFFRWCTESLPVWIMLKQLNRDSNGGYVWKYPAHVTATERLYIRRTFLGSGMCNTCSVILHYFKMKTNNILFSRVSTDSYSCIINFSSLLMYIIFQMIIFMWFNLRLLLLFVQCITKSSLCHQ